MATRRVIHEEPAPPPSGQAPRQVHVTAASIQAKREERAKEKEQEKAKLGQAPPPPRLVASPPPDDDSDEPETDEETRDLYDQLEKQDEQIALGIDERTLPKKPATQPLLRMSDGDRFDHYFEKNRKKAGRRFVSLVRVAPEEAACDLPSLDLDAAGVKDYGDVVAYVRRHHWDGRAHVYRWTLKLNGRQLTTFGTIHCDEDVARQYEWDQEQAVKLEAQRTFEQRTAGAAARKEPQGAPAVTQQQPPAPRFCTYCKHDLSPLDRYCGGCSRATPTGGVVPQPQAITPAQVPQTGMLGELLPFIERMIDGRMRGTEDSIRAIAERLNMPAPQQVSQPAAQVLPPAPQPMRAKDAQGRWGIFVGTGAEARFVLDEAQPEAKPEIFMVDGVEHFKVKTEKGYELLRREQPKGPATATAAVANGALPGTPAYVAEVLKQGKAQHEELSKALGKDEEDDEEEIPDGFTRVGKDGPIVPTKLLKKHPLAAALFQNLGPMLSGIAPEDVGGLVKGFAAYVSAQTSGGGDDSEAAKVDGANERRMKNEREDQKLREGRIRQQLAEAEAVEKKAKALERLRRARGAGGEAAEASESVDGAGGAAGVGSDADSSTEDEDAPRDQPTPQRRAPSEGAFIPED